MGDRPASGPSPKAIIAPVFYRWARQRGLWSVADAARVADATPADWERWEAGEDRATMTQLRQIADALHRPLGVFFLPEPPLIRRNLLRPDRPTRP